MKKFLRCSMIFVLGMVTFSTFAQTFKIASSLPSNTEYGRALEKINAEWIKASGGKVKLQIVPNGAAGDEDEVARKIKLGSFQGGLFSSIGLGRINNMVATMSAPTLIKSDKQFTYVLEKLTPSLDQGFKDKGYVAITYSPGGWVYIFSKVSIATTKDLNGRKIGISDSDKALGDTFYKLGFKPINVQSSDYLISLSNNMMDTFMSSPIVAAQKQWFGVANNMLELPIAPFLGGILIDERAWKKVPADLQEKLIAIARNITQTDLYPAATRLEKEAIAIMKQNKLNIVTVSDSARKEWLESFEKGNKMMIEEGGFDKATYDKIKVILTGFKD